LFWLTSANWHELCFFVCYGIALHFSKHMNVLDTTPRFAHRFAWVASVVCLLSLILWGKVSWAQREIPVAWRNVVNHTTADAGANASYLTPAEQDVIYFTNLARMNGRLFADTYLADYLKANPEVDAKSTYVKSLIETLRKQPKLPPLAAHEGLSTSAQTHADAMGKSGKVGHQSPTGKNYNERIRDQLKNKTVLIAENCSYGITKPVDIVIDLLIDEGIATLGHRKNMLTPSLVNIGIGIASHKVYGTNCVMDFCAKLN
jgi:uncharacterized protein YkwD